MHIISVTCPETLSSNLKEDIILSFQSIKPESFKGIVDDDSIKGTNITEKDNLIELKPNQEFKAEFDIEFFD